MLLINLKDNIKNIYKNNINGEIKKYNAQVSIKE